MTYVNKPDRQRGATVRWVFADATARANFTPLHGGNAPPGAFDIGSEAWQLDDDSFWSLKVASPITWVAKGAAGSGSGDVVGPATATDNALVRFDAATGKLVKNGTVTEDDNGRLSGTQAGAIGNGTMIAPIGASAADPNVLVAAGAASHTFDIQVVSSSLTLMVVHVFGIDQTSSLKMKRVIRVHVDRGGAGAAIFDTIEDKFSRDSGSIFESGGNPILTFGAYAPAGNALRITLPSDAAHNVKWNIHAFTYIDSYPV